MFDEDLDIITKIKNEKTIDEIAFEMKKSINDIHRCIINLKNKGMVFNKIVSDNGKIRYFIQKYPEDNSCFLNMKLCNKRKFSAMLISDLHFGNELENIGYLEKVYDYMRDYDMHIIINGGDLIDGSFSKGVQKIDDPICQLDYVIKNYPFDKRILNLICLGNHDFSLYKAGVNIEKSLEAARYDLIPLGYGLGGLNFGGAEIFIRHFIPDYIFESIKGKLVLEGHKHKAGFWNIEDGLLVNIPTLSDLVLGKHAFAGTIRMDLTFDDDGYISSGRFEQFIVCDKLYTVNESNLDLSYLSHDLLKEEEIKPKLKVLHKNGLSQTEKFNLRWKH